jgi:hypothetical protein
MESIITKDYINKIIESRALARNMVLQDGEDDDYARILARPENQTKYHHLSEIKDKDDLHEKWSDKWWRLNNLYYIIDERGNRRLFKCKPGQKELLKEIWYRTIILKERQYGFTTFIDIYLLDECLFNSNVEAAIIAHNLDDAKKIFRRKILYPYQQLPESLKKRIGITAKSKTELGFTNGSTISVSTSVRSGTVQYLHISEFGKICAKYPEKAREIVTGALEAVAKGQMVFIESTAEGRFGYFYDYCKRARDASIQGKSLTELDFKYYFFPWWKDPERCLSPSQYQPIPQEIGEYFDGVELKLGIKLSLGQKSWWVNKWMILGDDMKREYPATFEEAFEFVVKGAYFTSQFVAVRKEGRITKVPYEPAISVDTWWDLGMNDIMAIWFTQDVGREIHVIDYFESSDEGFEYYWDVLEQKKYRYGQHWAPHDISVRELGPGAKRWETAKNLGIYFNTVPRPKSKVQESIQALRSIFPLFWFDEERCAQLIVHLENYRKEWDPHLGTYKRTPLHNEASNAADAGQTLAMGHKTHLQISNQRIGIGVINQQPPPPGGWT